MSGVLRWWWVRHAPTGATSMAGWSDLPADLTDAAALERTARALPEAAHLLTSDMSRAVATAGALRRPGWTSAGVELSFREQNFGEWEGVRHDDLAARFPAEAAAFWDDPARMAPPGGESFADQCARVAASVRGWTAQLNREGSAGDVIAVAHGGAIRAALAHALGLDPARALAFEIAPLSITRLDWIGPGNETESETGGMADGQGAWRVCFVNAAPNPDQ